MFTFARQRVHQKVYWFFLGGKVKDMVRSSDTKNIWIGQRPRGKPQKAEVGELPFSRINNLCGSGLEPRVVESS